MTRAPTGPPLKRPRDLVPGDVVELTVHGGSFTTGRVEAVNQHGVTFRPGSPGARFVAETDFYRWGEIDRVDPPGTRDVGRNVAPHGPEYRGIRGWGDR